MMMMEREETRHKEEERQRDEIFNPLLFEHQLETDMKNDPYGSKTQEHCKLSFKEMSEMVAKNADGTYNQQAFKRILEQFLDQAISLEKINVIFDCLLGI